MATPQWRQGALPSQPRPRRQWPRSLLRALRVGIFETAALVIVIFVAAFAITKIGTVVVSRPGAPAAVVLPDRWPIVRWLVPIVFVTASLKALVKELGRSA